MTTSASTDFSPASKLAEERVLVLDFGSQFAQLIARRVREQHVYCEIVRHNITAERVSEHPPPHRGG
jgi:GMP synthase (glutamine-hydrolysing)